MERALHFREEPGAARRAARVGVLRGPAHGQRQPRRPPRAGPGLQGHLPALQDHAGYYVGRKAGWDCHGLPVELEIEKRLGFDHKEQIEAYGVAEFNQLCRESVTAYVDDWNRMTERIGMWLDLDDPYMTMTDGYIESVWWILSEFAKQGLLYEGYKVVPYCPRCGTALSSHEVASGYQMVTDPSVYVRFPLRGRRRGPSARAPRRRHVLAADGLPVSLLVWTTTPWTLISNVAAAVGPDIQYAPARLGDEHLILAADLVARRAGRRRRDRGDLPGLGTGRPPLPAALPASSRPTSRPGGSSPPTSSPPTRAPASSTSPRPSAPTT